MPSGAKKRKAAKKKMIKEASNGNSATHSHGDDDPKHQDGKESDGGEVSSPASLDQQNHQHPFTEGEEEEGEKRGVSSSVRSFVTEDKSMEENNNDAERRQKAAPEEEGVVQIDIESKSEDFESKNVIIESVKESHDESHVLEKKTVVVETATPVDSAKPVYYLSEVVNQVHDSISVGEASNLVVETASVVESDEVSELGKDIHVNECASVDNSMSSGVVEQGLKENGEKKLPSLDENTGISRVLMDLESMKWEDEVVLTPGVDAATSSDSKDFGAQANEDKLLLSFNAPTDDASYCVKHVEDSETHECSDSQPLVASAPRTGQTTSWKSCCGMFELFMGSNR